MVQTKKPGDDIINEVLAIEDKENMGIIYEELRQIFNHYIDVSEDISDILSIWTIGTYIHNDFNSYPILFINATKGSGKSRLLRLLAELCNGTLTNSISEPVMFRTKDMLALDEFERVGNKEKQMLRELLNSAYKKGAKVIRMKEVRQNGTKEYEPEYFEVYRPIVMANIWGMDEVLADRCISIILEKSMKPEKIKLLEDFQYNEKIQNVKKMLNQCSLCNVVSEKMQVEGWNNYILEKYNNIHTHNTLNTHNTQTDNIDTLCSSMYNNIHIHNTLNTHNTHNNINNKTLSFFNKIDEKNIYGRNLEIFFPLLLIAYKLNDEVLLKILNTSSQMIYEKDKEDSLESLDLMLIDFISSFEESLHYYPIRELLDRFRQFSNINEEFMNEKWIGRALKRLCLVYEKRRVSSGITIILNVAKAKQKMELFKPK